MICLGIDYGKKRIGLAIGSVLPRGLGIIENKGDIDKISEEICRICKEEEAEKIVMGMPYRNAGEEGTIAPEIRDLGAQLEKMCGLPVVFEPEQFTSGEAKDMIKQSGKHYLRKSGKADEIAAILILEQYLSSYGASPDGSLG